MTKEQKIEAIRAKAIEANDEIVEQHSILTCDMDRSAGYVLSHKFIARKFIADKWKRALRGTKSD